MKNCKSHSPEISIIFYKHSSAIIYLLLQDLQLENNISYIVTIENIHYNKVEKAFLHKKLQNYSVRMRTDHQNYK